MEEEQLPPCLRVPKDDLKRLISLQFNYDRRRFIFWSFNTTYIGIAFFQTYSNVNIEGGNNPQLCPENAILVTDYICTNFLYSCLVSLIIAHLLQVDMMAGMIGYFSIEQKSRKLKKGYELLMAISYVLDVVFSFSIIGQYNSLQDTPFYQTKKEFLMLIIFFPFVQGLICVFCINQFRKSSLEFFYVQEEKDNLLENYEDITLDIVKQFLRT